MRVFALRSTLACLRERFLFRPLVTDFASRLVNRSDVLSPGEHMLFTRAQMASHAATTRPAGDGRKPFFNTVIWMVDREADLPDFLTVDNPRIRHIPIALPDSMAYLHHLVRSGEALGGTLLTWNMSPTTRP
jgi:hypothetical protein